MVLLSLLIQMAPQYLKSEHETASLPRDRLAVLEQNLLGKGSNKYVSSFKNHINPLYFGRVMYSINIIP